MYCNKYYKVIAEKNDARFKFNQRNSRKFSKSSLENRKKL